LPPNGLISEGESAVPVQKAALSGQRCRCARYVRSHCHACASDIPLDRMLLSGPQVPLIEHSERRVERTDVPQTLNRYLGLGRNGCICASPLAVSSTNYARDDTQETYILEFFRAWLRRLAYVSRAMAVYQTLHRTSLSMLIHPATRRIKAQAKTGFRIG
jgi:hypothetical protein